SSRSGVRLLKDLDVAIQGRDVLLVEDVVDTGLTLNFVCKTLALRSPASLTAVTLLDRPYRRLVENLPVRYVCFTLPAEFFVRLRFRPRPHITHGRDPLPPPVQAARGNPPGALCRLPRPRRVLRRLRLRPGRRPL